MGWKEYLEDYEEQEKEEYAQFIERVHDTRLSSFDTFPPTHRFPNFHQPASKMKIPSVYRKGKSIWSQTLLSGTTLMPLFPSPKTYFKEYHGFAIREIPGVLDFIKRTGKVAFYLRELPTQYEHLDFLQEIMTDLRPPVSTTLPLSVFFKTDELKRSSVEFDTLARLGTFYSDLESHMLLALGKRSSVDQAYVRCMNTYACLKSLGYKDIVEEILNSIILEPDEAKRIIRIATELIEIPLTDTTVRSFIFSQDQYLEQRKFAGGHSVHLPAPRFPGEIGKFLTRTLVHSPPTLHACEELYYHYKEEEVYEAANALNEGIISGNPNAIDEKTSELTMIMNSIWESKSLQRKTLGLRFGIHALFGVVGPVATLLTGGLGGLLAGLGVQVGNAVLTIKSEELAEKIAKISSPNYETIVYDFKKKYKLDASK